MVADIKLHKEIAIVNYVYIYSLFRSLIFEQI